MKCQAVLYAILAHKMPKMTLSVRFTMSKRQFSERKCFLLLVLGFRFMIFLGVAPHVRGRAFRSNLFMLKT